MEIFKDKFFVDELNTTLRNGGVISFVTDTVWGVGCLPTSEAGVEKIYRLKNRDHSKPLILMSDTVQNLIPYVKNIPDIAKSLINKHFPGALTLIFEKSDLTPYYVTSNAETVGIRVPDNEFFKQLCSVIDGSVLATTSANPSTMPAAKSYAETISYLNDDVDIIFEDYGYSCAGLESTVILALNSDFRILRQGVVKL